MKIGKIKKLINKIDIIINQKNYKKLFFFKF